MISYYSDHRKLIHKLKKTCHKNVSIHEKKKAFDRIQHPLIIKTLSKPGTERNYINLMKNMDKTSGNFVLHDKRLNTFPIETGDKERRPPSQFFNRVLKVLAITIRQEKEIKNI